MAITAVLGSGTAVLFIVLVVLLHFTKPELRPAEQMISQYAREPRGWIMKLAFYSFATSCLVVALGLWQQTGNQVVSLLLVTSGIGTALASLFVTDQPGTAKRSINGVLHLVSTFLVIPVFPIAVALFEAHNHRIVDWASWLVWVGFLGYLLCIIFMISRYHKLTAPAGYFQRLMIFSYAAWLFVTATTLA